MGTTTQGNLQQFADEDAVPEKVENDSHGTEAENTGDSVGIIYARVSSAEQAEEGNSIPTQIENLQSKADELGVALPFDPITDEGQTGTNFNRDGIKKVFELARSGQITHLFVDDVSRIGRTAPETLDLISRLQKMFGVTIVTNTGPFDINEIEDLISMTFRSLMSDIENRERGRKSLETSIHNFKHRRKWSSSNKPVPLGYRETDDGWIEPIPNQTDAVTDFFNTFLETESYTATAEHMRDTYDFPDSNITWNQAKRSLKQGVYIGKPSMDIKSDKIDEDEIVVNDPDLALINTEVHEQVQEIIAEKTKRHSSQSDTTDVLDLIFEFGRNPVLNLPDVCVVCPDSDCRAIMVKNGQRTLTNDDSEYHVHNYLCPECGKQRKFPTQDDLQAIKKQVT